MRIAFIGTGNIARQHAQGLAEQEKAEFVAGYDAIPGRARAFTENFGGQPYESLSEMLDEAAPDAAWVCLPPFAHGEAEIALLDRGIPFLVEKPVSNSIHTARQIAEKVEETGILVAAGYMNRYRRGVNRAKELLADDPAVLVHGAWIGGTPGVPWWRQKSLSGGQIVEQTTHIFDLVRYLVGEPETVCAEAARGFVRDIPDYDVEDASTVAVKFASGAVGSLISSCANRSGGGGVHLTIVARDHVSNFTGWDNALVIQKSQLEQEHIAGEPNIFAIEDAAFLRAVEEEDPSLVRSPYADAVKTLAFCLAANKALETNEVIDVASI
ncbi:MAG: Gfo/Idh/MocA family oxidoreductase [Chloroflexota bacterium]|nr:Gfo/Idh/MocA family oxidoreductase [Chloroflexota bacterium]